MEMSQRTVNCRAGSDTPAVGASRMAAACLAVVSILGGASAARGQIYADSVAQFSAVQGQGGWHYGYYGPNLLGPAGFTPLLQFGLFGAETYSRSCNCAGGYWTVITRTSSHGEGTTTSGGRTAETNWAVRRWVAPATGPLRITGEFSKLGCGGNGVLGRIFVGSTEVRTMQLDGCDRVGISYLLETCVQAGMAIDFVLDPLDSNDLYDLTTFTAVISGVVGQSPANALACLGGTATFFAAPAGTGTFTYQWRKDGTPISPAVNASASTPTLVIANVQDADAGFYDCIVGNSCGGSASSRAILAIAQRCSIADIVGTTNGPAVCGDSSVDGSDFIAFINSFSSGDPAIDPLADVAGGGASNDLPDGIIDGSDFIAFINAFSAGC